MGPRMTCFDLIHLLLLLLGSPAYSQVTDSSRQLGPQADLSERLWTRLTSLANSAHRTLGLDQPLDPLRSTSTLKYVHEGELLRLRLLLDNLTLEGLASLSVQEVTFGSPGVPGHARSTSMGVVRVAFTQVTLRATYSVRGSAAGHISFREGGDLDLMAPTVFLTSRVNVTVPEQQEGQGQPRHSRVKVLWLKTEVSIATPVLTLRPASRPPQWVRQQVQTKLEELSSDLSHGHGAVRLLLRRWGKLLKKLIHRTARPSAM